MTTVVVSENGLYSAPNQVIDGITVPSYKWFSLQTNLLDGSFHPIDGTGALQQGWWGSALSDASGNLASPPTVTVTFGAATSVSSIRVTGDSLLNEFPVNFVIQLYDAGNALLLTDTVTGNTLVDCLRTYPQTYSVTKYVLTVSKLNMAARTAKLLQSFDAGIIIRSDSILAKVTDALVHIAFGSTDTISVKSSDMVAVLQNSLITYDTLSPKLTEIVFATNKLNSTEGISVKVTDTALVTAEITSTDVSSVSGNTEGMQLTADLYVTDTAPMIISEVANITNIHTVMDGLERRVYGKVEITYTDPFVDQSITASANTVADYTSPGQTADNITEPDKLWFSLNDNKLDGTYNVIDSKAEVGWWSKTLSNADGTFATNPQLTVQFDSRSLTNYKVVGDDKANVWPVDFNISCYDANGVLLRSVDVVGNNLVTWTQDTASNPVLLCTSMVLTVSKINRGLYTCRVLEFVTSVVQAYTGDDRLEFINLIEERDTTQGSLPIGNVTSNEIDVRLDNSDRYFDPATLTSPLSTLLKPNRRIIAWLGAEIIPGTIEWHQLGVFWTTGWQSPKADVVTTVTARDRLNLMTQTTYSTSVVKTNVSLYELAVDVLTDFGLSSSEYSIDASLMTMMVPVAWFERITHREAIRMIAEASLSVAYAAFDGSVVLGSSAIPVTAMARYSEHTNIVDIENPQDWTQVINTINVNWTVLKQGASENVIDISQLATVINPGQTITLNLDFNTKPSTNIGTPVITGGADLVVTMSTVYAWGMVISIKNNGTAIETLDTLTVTGTPLNSTTLVETVYNQALISALGPLSYTLSNPLVQSKGLANSMCNTLLATYSDPHRLTIIDSRGDAALNLGDRVSLPTGSDGILTRQTYVFDGSLTSNVQVLNIE